MRVFNGEIVNDHILICCCKCTRGCHFKTIMVTKTNKEHNNNQRNARTAWPVKPAPADDVRKWKITIFGYLFSLLMYHFVHSMSSWHWNDILGFSGLTFCAGSRSSLRSKIIELNYLHGKNVLIRCCGAGGLSFTSYHFPWPSSLWCDLAFKTWKNSERGLFMLLISGQQFPRGKTIWSSPKLWKQTSYRKTKDCFEICNLGLQITFSWPNNWYF